MITMPKTAEVMKKNFVKIGRPGTSHFTLAFVLQEGGGRWIVRREREGKEENELELTFPFPSFLLLSPPYSSSHHHSASTFIITIPYQVTRSPKSARNPPRIDTVSSSRSTSQRSRMEFVQSVG